MAKGDIVLITFTFTDLSGDKLRTAYFLLKQAWTLRSALLRHRLTGKNRLTFYSPLQILMDLKSNLLFEQVRLRH